MAITVTWFSDIPISQSPPFPHPSMSPFLFLPLKAIHLLPVSVFCNVCFSGSSLEKTDSRNQTLLKLVICLLSLLRTAVARVLPGDQLPSLESREQDQLGLCAGHRHREPVCGHGMDTWLLRQLWNMGRPRADIESACEGTGSPWSALWVLDAISNSTRLHFLLHQ